MDNELSTFPDVIGSLIPEKEIRSIYQVPNPGGHAEPKIEVKSNPVLTPYLSGRLTPLEPKGYSHDILESLRESWFSESAREVMERYSREGGAGFRVLLFVSALLLFGIFQSGEGMYSGC